jgi:hypothetical protein
MALNPQNLRSLADLPPEERKEISAKGGHARKAALDRKKSLRLALEELLASEVKLRNGGTKSGAEALAAKLFEKGLNGDVRAFETIRATVGQDTVQKVMVADVDQDVINEVESAVLGTPDGADSAESEEQ